MGKIELDFRVLGDVGTNCYLLCNQETKECILIDAPDLPVLLQLLYRKMRWRIM